MLQRVGFPQYLYCYATCSVPRTRYFWTAIEHKQPIETRIICLHFILRGLDVMYVHKAGGEIHLDFKARAKDDRRLDSLMHTGGKSQQRTEYHSHHFPAPTKVGGVGDQLN